MEANNSANPKRLPKQLLTTLHASSLRFPEGNHCFREWLAVSSPFTIFHTEFKNYTNW